MTGCSGLGWSFSRPAQTAFLTGLLLFAGIQPQAESAGNERTCTILMLSGDTATVDRSGMLLMAVPNLKVAAGDTVRTGESSRLEIGCDDGIRITVAPQSVINLGNLISPKEPDQNILMELFSGLAGFIAPDRNWKSFDVRAPRAIASVRSTEWLVAADESRTSVFVRRGVVAVSPDGAQPATLQMGQGIDIETGMRAASFPVKNWSDERIKETSAALGFSWR